MKSILSFTILGLQLASAWAAPINRRAKAAKSTTSDAAGSTPSAAAVMNMAGVAGSVQSSGIGGEFVSTGVMAASAVLTANGVLVGGASPTGSADGSQPTGDSSSSGGYSSSGDSGSSSGSSDGSSSVSSDGSSSSSYGSSGSSDGSSSSGSSSSGSSDGSSSSGSSESSSSSSSSSGSSHSSSSSSKGSSIDVTVLQLAFVLESLESSFYQQGLQKFGLSDFQSSGYSSSQSNIIVEQLQEVFIDESTHRDTLSSVISSLGSSAFSKCQFDFTGVFTDASTFIATARTLEAVGVSAYLGAAHLLTDQTILDAAGSILTIEARHQSLLNMLNSGSFAPQAFEIPLAPASVLSLASGFLQGCSASDLGLTANNALSVREMKTSSTHFQTGSQLQFSSSVDLTKGGLFCHMIVGGAAKAVVFDFDSCIVPPKIDGIVHVYVARSSTPLIADILTQDSSIIVAGPAIIFIDSNSNSITSMMENSRWNHNSLGSSDFGMKSMNRNNNRYKNSSSDRHGNGNSNTDVTIVVHTTEIITQRIVEVINNRGSGSSGSSSGSSRSSSSSSNSRSSGSSNNSRSGSSGSSSSGYKRGYGDVREVGWGSVSRRSIAQRSA